MLLIVMTGRDPATLTAPQDVRLAHEAKLKAAEARLAALDAAADFTVPKENTRES